MKTIFAVAIVILILLGCVCILGAVIDRVTQKFLRCDDEN